MERCTTTRVLFAAGAMEGYYFQQLEFCGELVFMTYIRIDHVRFHEADEQRF